VARPQERNSRRQLYGRSGHSSARLRRNRWNGSSSESERSRLRAKGRSIKTIMEELAPLYAGLGADYFGFCQKHEVLIPVTRWVRCDGGPLLWSQWKNNGAADEALIARGLGRGQSSNKAAAAAWVLVSRPKPSPLIGLSNAHFNSLGPVLDRSAVSATLEPPV